jgi:ABC-2 type transport system permease protein
MRDAALYWDFIKISLKKNIEYPGAFWSHVIAKMAGWAADLALVFLIVWRFDHVLGWSMYEVLFLYSLNVITYALAGVTMFAPFRYLPRLIQDGSFDEILTKPMNPFLYLIFRNILTGYLGNIIVGVVALALSLSMLGLSLSLLGLLHLLLVLAGGTLIQASMFIFTAVPAFWFVKADSFVAMRGALEDFTKYPLSIYDKWIQVLLTVVIPFGFVSFYPAQYFLAKHDFLMFHPVFQYLSPVVGLLLMALAYGFFTVGLRHYKSTGS